MKRNAMITSHGAYVGACRDDSPASCVVMWDSIAARLGTLGSPDQRATAANRYGATPDKYSRNTPSSWWVLQAGLYLRLDPALRDRVGECGRVGSDDRYQLGCYMAEGL